MSKHTDTPPVDVVFRVWNRKGFPLYGSVIALFPYLAAEPTGVYCDSYEHIGQHAAADYRGVRDATHPATPEEYADLKAELEAAPYFYKLRVRKRVSGLAAYQARREQVRAMRQP